MTTKLDLYREHATEYAAGQAPRIVRIEPANYLTIDGAGDPGGKEFQDCIAALYAIAFTIKMAKRLADLDYHVCKLEGLWTEPDANKNCHWKLMIRTPDFITPEDLKTAIDVSVTRGRHSLAESVKLETIREGTCIQALHVGPYAEEAATIRVMEEIAVEQGFKFTGLHHEIYLSDPRRVEPAKLKTILRHRLVRTPYLGYE
jgi:hypothetical protein